MSSQPTTYLTPEEYLAIERKAQSKSEYINGEIVAKVLTELLDCFAQIAARLAFPMFAP